MISLDSLQAAQRLVYTQMSTTPQYRWPLLEQALGHTLWLKHENHTPAGAFKVRGGIVYIHELLEREPHVKGLVSATRGNHGQSIARAATARGLRSVIVVPEGNSVEKNAAMRAFGAELVVHGADFTESSAYAQTLAEREGLHRVPSYHESLVKGVASYALELFGAVQLDALYVPIGMGSGACACIAARDALGLKTEIVGVTSAHARAYKLSIDAGTPIDSPANTQIADGMAVRAVAPEAVAILKKGLARVVEVSDDEVKAAMRLLYSATHNVAEGAGAAALAAAYAEREHNRGKAIASILCGGNVDSVVFAKVLAP
jgi:threonine dehydratase